MSTSTEDGRREQSPALKSQARMPLAYMIIPTRDPQACQYESLSLLASGLHQLSGLKKLQMLDVSRRVHNIGVEELRWMREHWPVLRSIVGLEERVGITLPHM